ncbi:MAG: hypothetical protein WDM96_01820 [Lacunisphaera sp.]
MVDATDVTRGIFEVTETIPASAGPLTLLYPQWIPGHHSPTGTIARLAGLRITANGKALEWKRDAVDVFAFHVEVPADAASVVASFQYLAPTETSQARIVTTPTCSISNGESTSLYPAGYYVRRLLVEPAVKYPAGWKAATALTVARQDGADRALPARVLRGARRQPGVRGDSTRGSKHSPPACGSMFLPTSPSSSRPPTSS